ncbi:hypothetical protein [Streptomyces sp. NPDC056401]|uniref:hypothetical protein n=1 Tax=Streptomyces sp. NPDC056401 TaxID=3345809 RepID=UPI0035DD89D3
MADPRIVNADDRRTWPPALEHVIDYACSQFSYSIPTGSDFGILTDLAAGEYEFVLDSAEQWVRNALSGSMMLVHHATRLLPHEVGGVQSDGLLRATPERVQLRHATALAAGSVSHAEYEFLRTATTHELPMVPSALPRDAEVCAITTMDPAARGKLNMYFTRWGGEIHTMNEQAWRAPRFERLRTIGNPYLVSALIDVTNTEVADSGGTPGLAYTFAATSLGLTTNDGLMHYLHDIPGPQVLRVTPWPPC